jgi:hypothetical protein
MSYMDNFDLSIVMCRHYLHESDMFLFFHITDAIKNLCAVIVLLHHSFLKLSFQSEICY